MTDIEREVYERNPAIYFACKLREAKRLLRRVGRELPSIGDTRDTQERMWEMSRAARVFLGPKY